MTTAAIEYIWKAILESERSDELSCIDALNRSLMPQPDRSDRPDRPDRPGAANRASITTAATEPPQTMSSPLISLPE